MVFLLNYSIFITCKNDKYQIQNLHRLQKYLFITPNLKDYGLPATQILICPLGIEKGYTVTAVNDVLNLI